MSQQGGAALRVFHSSSFYSWLDLHIIKAFTLTIRALVHSAKAHSSQTASYITGKDLFFVMRNYISDIFDPN